MPTGRQVPGNEGYMNGSKLAPSLALVADHACPTVPDRRYLPLAIPAAHQARHLRATTNGPADIRYWVQ